MVLTHTVKAHELNRRNSVLNLDLANDWSQYGLESTTVKQTSGAGLYAGGFQRNPLFWLPSMPIDTISYQSFLQLTFCSMQLVSFLDPTLEEGKRSGTLRAVPWFC